MIYVILVLYIAIVFLGSLRGSTDLSKTPEGYFLANRDLFGRSGIWVVIFSMIGLAIAAQPFDTINDMGRLAFGGLAVLFPTTLAILRWGGLPSRFGIASILIGELLLVAFYTESISKDYLFGFDSAIVILFVCFSIVGFGKGYERLR